jgi:ribonuclease HI
VKQKLKQVTIFCDGSSLGNGSINTRAAAVAILQYRNNWRAVGEYIGSMTNQQAEIAAATIGLSALKEPCRVHLFTDSRYVVETMMNRFKRKANLDWWERLDKAARPHQIDWEWTKGHAGHLIQEACDKAARDIAMLGYVDEKILREAEETVSNQEPIVF